MIISRLRCFIAIDIEDPVLIENIVRLQNDIVQTTGIKMVEPQNIHLTLRFLGEISLSMVKEVEKILNSITYNKFKIRRLGIMPDHKSFEPHVTIARVKSRRRENLVSILKKVKEMYIGRMIVDNIRLKKSTLTPRGPIYDTLFERKFT